jgi:hypothetical protein
MPQPSTARETRAATWPVGSRRIMSVTVRFWGKKGRIKDEDEHEQGHRTIPEVSVAFRRILLLSDDLGWREERTYFFMQRILAVKVIDGGPRTEPGG